MRTSIAIFVIAVLFGCSSARQRKECREVCISYNTTIFDVTSRGLGEPAAKCRCIYSLEEK